ncbi:hypothetical protein H9P43_002846 [Blastocladiella emersonii ATCC 22665]|nr:hypothetical protein H9P43_002846 [Blastocladiella emersonii ATCC 22665]
MTAPPLEIQSQDVIRLIQQFLKENNLTRSLACLQDESQVVLNAVDSAEALEADVLAGRWDAVLAQAQALDLPRRKRADLYEHVFLELVEQGDRAAARVLLRQTAPLQALRDGEDPDRYAHLERLLTLVEFHPRVVYGEASPRDARRVTLAKSLLAEVHPVPPSRLLALLGQALRWQAAHGSDGDGSSAPKTAATDRLTAERGIDLFRGTPPALHSGSGGDVDAPVSHAYADLALAPGQTVETAVFAPTGDTLATGSADGFIELWHAASGKLRTDLAYQAQDRLMAMSGGAVLALAFSSPASRDASSAQQQLLLASGSQAGQIKVWQVATGKCVRRFNGAHAGAQSGAGGVTALAFSPDGSQVLSAGFDGMVRLHGIKSGQLLKEFRGHASFVNCVAFSFSSNSDGSGADGQGSSSVTTTTGGGDNRTIFSGGSDGTVKVWDARLGTCTRTVVPTGAANQRSVLALHWLASRGHLQVAAQSKSVVRLDARGTLAWEAPCDAALGVHDPVAAAASPHGDYAYLVTESGTLAIVTVRGKAVRAVDTGLTKVLGMAAHPAANVLALWTEGGRVALWRA